jgi:hypothetical protein
MILALEIAMAIGGLIVLVAGKFPLAPRRVASGLGAGFAGFVFLLPWPVSFAVGFAVGYHKAAVTGNANLEEFTTAFLLVETAIALGCLVVGFLAAFLGSLPDPEVDVWPGRAGGSSGVEPQEETTGETGSTEAARSHWLPSWPQECEQPTDARERPDVLSALRRVFTAVLGVLFVAVLVGVVVLGVRFSSASPASQPTPKQPRQGA